MRHKKERPLSVSRASLCVPRPLTWTTNCGAEMGSVECQQTRGITGTLLSISYLLDFKAAASFMRSVYLSMCLNMDKKPL